MFQPIVKKSSLVSPSGKVLYQVRATYGNSLVDCISFAVSREYRESGKLITQVSTEGEMMAKELAYASGKRVLWYRSMFLDVIDCNETGVGCVYVYEDLSGDNFLICWKDRTDNHVTVTSNLDHPSVLPRWS